MCLPRLFPAFPQRTAARAADCLLRSCQPIMAGVAASLQKLVGIVKARPVSSLVVVLAAWPVSLFLLPILLPAALLALAGLFLLPARFHTTRAGSAPRSVQPRELPATPSAQAKPALKGHEAAEDRSAPSALTGAGLGVPAAAKAVGGETAAAAAAAPPSASKEDGSGGAQEKQEVAPAAATVEDGLDWNFPKAGEPAGVAQEASILPMVGGSSGNRGRSRPKAPLLVSGCHGNHCRHGTWTEHAQLYRLASSRGQGS